MKKIIKKIKDAGLPFMFFYSNLYVLFIIIICYFYIKQDFVNGINPRINEFLKTPLIELFMMLGFFLMISYPITVVLSLFSISKKLTRIENNIKQND